MKEKVIEELSKSLGGKVKVVSDWIKEIKDFKTPAVSISTFKTWPNHIEINVWANTPEDRDKVAKSVVKALAKMRSYGITVYNVMPIKFEEEGILQPGSWKKIEGSEQIFRTLVEVEYI